MNTDQPTNEAAAMRAAIKAAGGLKALADALGRKPNVVSNWIKRGAPTEVCPAIQELTGIRCEDLRPTVDWEQFRRVLCAVERGAFEVSDDAQPPVGTASGDDNAAGSSDSDSKAFE